MDSTQLENERLLKVGDAATLLGLKVGTVYGLVAKRQIRYFKLGSAVRIPRAALEEYLAAREVAAI